MDSIRVFGAILAGGIGKRVERYHVPKQFITIGGVPILVKSLRVFLENPHIDDLFVAMHPDWIEYADRLLSDSFSHAEYRRIHLVPGGKERLDSFSNVLDEIVRTRGFHAEDILICHDSVRPFVRQQMIDDCIAATRRQSCALTVVPVADTLHIAGGDGLLDGTLPRENLFHGQTPSGFKVGLLRDVLSAASDDAKSRSTGTTQLLLQQGYKIAVVQGHTSNFKITTDNDLDIADRMVRAEAKSRDIELLDCTLRDGGIAIDFAFGNERIQSIKKCLENAGVKYIECGYIDSKKGTPSGRTCFDSERSVEACVLSSGKKSGVTYLAMIDFGTFDVASLSPASETGIDGIRLAFHKEHWREAVGWGKTILSKGYRLFIQPMVSMRYSDEEFRELVGVCNRELPEAEAFYIVDSFGQMDNVALLHKLELADQLVAPSMKLGFHAHNNRQMAFSNAMAVVSFPARHPLMLDCSIMGMGKGAGNLCTELIMPVLLGEGCRYDVVGIYSEISTYFSQVLKEHPWGYSLDYYLASMYGCTPSYIKIFVKDCRVTTDILVDLLKNMPDAKRAACDRVFASEYLAGYFMDKKE